MSAKDLKVTLEDGRSFTLGAVDWIGEGGEGAVYKKGDLAIKVVEDRKALAKKEPKLRVFRAMKHPALATPSSFAYDEGGAMVGYAMPMIEGIPLARLMSPAWRVANGYDDAKMEAVGKSMSKALLALHANGCWGGDVNEFNWRVKGERAVLIDCDSWGCPGHAVSAMLPSIADPKAGGRYELESDWYALAVLLFTLFCGIHPFRGSVPGFGPKDMVERMRQGVSVLRAGASWPASVPGPDGLPKGLRAWLKATLEDGARTAPPMSDWGKQKPARAPVRSSGSIELPAPFVRWVAPGWALLEDGSVLDLASKASMSPPSPRATRWIDSASGSAWWMWQEGSSLNGKAISGEASFGTPLPVGSKVEFWNAEPFALRDMAWSSFTVRRLGPQGVKAMASAQGPLSGVGEVFDGCMVRASMGAYAMLRPMSSGKGAMALALKAPETGARIAMASCQGDFEFVEWACSSSVRQVIVARKGVWVSKIDGSLDWACALGASEALAQIDGKAWIVASSGAKELAGWSGSSSPACCWQGSLWRVEAGSSSAKAYSLSKILAAASF